MWKRLLCSFLVLFYFVHSMNAQTYGNEWINYSQTYYKFGVFRDDIYRISISQLTALGLPTSVNGANLQLFRDGAEVAMYVSNNGLLSGTDYVEFYGEKANGVVDLPLFKNASAQLNPAQNLLSDTAYYFLTFNASTNNNRFVERINNLNSPPAKENYFWDKTRVNYRSGFVSGTSYYFPSTDVIYLCSSQYEDGEGFFKYPLSTSNDSVTYTCLFPYKVAGAPDASFKTAVVGNSYIPSHRMKLFANIILVGDSTYSQFGFKRFNVNLPMSYLTTANKLVMKYTPMNTNVANNEYDRYGIAYTELRYPRQFNFNNVDSYYVELDPKASDYYLEFSNFKNNGVAPKLYDITSNEYIIGDISVAGLIRFLIPASLQAKRFFIQSQAATSSVGSVSNLKLIQFKNYTQSSNQGNYIILSHARLFNDGNGTNYVNEYKNYRASIAGGAYDPIVVDVNDLYNEFGYGYTYHSQAVKNFLYLAYSNPVWNAKLKFVFIIGKGINYKDYLTYTSGAASSYPFPIVPSYGDPCSDNLLTAFTFDSKPQIPIGRLPVWNGTDIKIYLDKIKDHELLLNDFSNQTSDAVLWKKNVLHIAGANESNGQGAILAGLAPQKQRIEDTLYGGKVTTIKKSTTSAVETANSALIDSLFKGGLNLVQFFGHGSASTLDYNLDNPELMTNYKKYPVFLANGCGVGNVFILSVGQRSLGEKFVLSPQGGSIAFIASNNTGISDRLTTYTDSLYKQVSVTSYGKSIGEQMVANISSLNLAADGMLRQHAEQIILDGDPATKLYSFPKPDYAVEEKGLTFKQLNLTTNLDSFDIQVVIFNLGKYTKDSLSVYIKRTLPNGTDYVLLNKKYPGLAFSDTIRLRVPILGTVSIGDNAIDIQLDQEGFIDEISENNNSIRHVFTIYNDDLVPVYPYEFGIVSQQNVVLKGSTLNPFAPLHTYLIQIDTTEKFNSPLLTSTSITEKGGVIKWQPPITLRDSTVYYWRTAMDTSAANPKYKWSYSSFIYISGSSPGWNQSHYYQYQKDAYTNMYLDSANRKFVFVGTNKKLQVQNVCLYSPAPYYYQWPDYRVKMNGAELYSDGCDPYPGYSSLQFVVIDTLNGALWKNDVVGSSGRFGSYMPCRTDSLDDPFFEFSFLNAASRKGIMDFIDSIPDGYYMMVQPRLCTGSNCGSINKTFIKQWKADTTMYGSNNSLYHKLYNLGFTMIDSFYKNRPMIFFAKKNVVSSVSQAVEADSTKVLTREFNFVTYLYEGDMLGTKIGPAKKWNSFLRQGFSTDPGIGDSVLVDIYGVDLNNTETLLASVRGDTSLSFIDETMYPFLKLKMVNRDNNFTTPQQVAYWRVLYQLAPEAALNPNRYLVYTDSVTQGQKTRIELAVENLTEIPMDSMLIKYDVIDRNKIRKNVGTKRYSPIAALDTIHAVMDISSADIPGSNLLVVEANPNNDQIEQYHPNNIGFLNNYVVPDKQNPLIDVTFDGVHIMEKDIVSAKPFITITLRDENKFLAIDDTSLAEVYLRYPGDNSTAEHYIPFDGTVLKFIPANLSDGKAKNLARLEFRPSFTIDGNDYLLIVKAKDKAGNISGNYAYKVGFEVVNKPAISSVVNYPNPFTTSTQFVFTITGSELPSNLKIQILSPSGKIVKEILKSDLGPLHIGTNITEYKWKGDDQFGQPLGNGVYLYRVVSNLHGEQLEHYKRSNSQNADKWIEKGFGKLYIMR